MTLQEDARNAIRARLLETWDKEQDPHVKDKIADAVAELARQYTDDRMPAWNELLAALLQASQSPYPKARDSAFRILATTPGIIEHHHEETEIEECRPKVVLHDEHVLIRDQKASFFLRGTIVKFCVELGY